MVVSAAGQSKPGDSAALGTEGDDKCLGMLPGEIKQIVLLYLAAQKGRHVHIP